MAAVSQQQMRPEWTDEKEALPGGPPPPGYVPLVERCWSEEPTDRPTFEAIITHLRELLEDVATSRRSSLSLKDRQQLQSMLQTAFNRIHAHLSPPLLH